MPPEIPGFDLQIDNGVFTYTYTGSECNSGYASGSNMYVYIALEEYNVTPCEFLF